MMPSAPALGDKLVRPSGHAAFVWPKSGASTLWVEPTRVEGSPRFPILRSIETLQIIVTVPVLLDLLLCHSRAWLPREESRSFPTSSSGIRDSSRAPDTRAGMTEKFDRADVRVTILCRTQ